MLREGNEKVEEFVKHLETDYQHAKVELVVTVPVAPVKSKLILLSTILCIFSISEISVLPICKLQ